MRGNTAHCEKRGRKKKKGKQEEKALHPGDKEPSICLSTLLSDSPPNPRPVSHDVAPDRIARKRQEEERKPIRESFQERKNTPGRGVALDLHVNFTNRFPHPPQILLQCHINSH